MNPSSTLVFFGTEDFSLPSLKALIENGFPITCVVTKPDAPRGRSKQLVAPVVKAYALKHDIQVLQPEKLRDIENELISLNPVAGILVSYGKILPKRTLELFEPLGIINVHPSLLPCYRGPSPIEAAIKNGDDETGISLIRLTPEMDAGPIYEQKTIALDGTETRSSLTSQLATAGADLLIDKLPEILSGQLKPSEQQNDDVSYTSLLSKQDGILDPITDDAYALERKIRAYLGYPKARLQVNGYDVIVTSSKVVATKDDYPLTIACANETYLALTEVTAPSGKTMHGDAFVRGYSG